MQSVLEDFAYCNIAPEVQHPRNDSEYGHMVKLVSANEKKLFGMLGEEEQDQFQKYIDARDELRQLAAVKNLIHGYRMGVLMTAEAFVTGTNLFTEEETY